MLFNLQEETRIEATIRDVELRTSGEIRIFVEDTCEREHPIERAAEIFQLHGIFHTRERNAVLLYLAPVSRQFAIWGDTGIHAHVGFNFWEAEKKLLRFYLQKDEACNGVCAVVEQIGQQLQTHFPALEGDNPNELPDDIIYG